MNRRRFVVGIRILSAFALWLSPPSARAETLEPLPAEDTAGNVGLFVGVNHYARSNYARLSYAVNDAVGLADAFVLRLKFIPPHQARLMIVGQPTGESIERLRALRAAGVQIVGEAGRNACKAAVQRVCQLASGTNSLILVSFSGHGQEHAGTMYFVPPDGEPGMADSMVSLVDVKMNLDSRAELKRWLFIDACRLQLIPGKGAVEFPAVTREFRRAFAEASGRIVFASCDADQVSLEDGQAQQGVFTKALLDGLENPHSNLDSPYVTIGHLVRYASNQSFKRASQIASDNPNIPPAKVQRPWFEARGESLGTPVAISPDAKASLARRQRREQRTKQLVQLARLANQSIFSIEEASAIERAIDEWRGEEANKLLNKIEGLLSAEGTNDPEAFLAWWRAQRRVADGVGSGRGKGDVELSDPFVPERDLQVSHKEVSEKRVVLLGPIQGLAPKHAAAALLRLESALRSRGDMVLRRVALELPDGVLDEAVAGRMLSQQGGKILITAAVSGTKEEVRRLNYNGVQFNNQIWSATLTISLARTEGGRVSIGTRAYIGEKTYLDGQHVADATSESVANAFERFEADTGFHQSAGLVHATKAKP